MTLPKYRTVRPPDILMEAGPPVVPTPEYEDRLSALRAKLVNEGLDAAIVYGDREHFGNMMHLVGFDPRFEEALLIVTSQGRPTMILGNEGMDHSRVARPDLDRILCQSLSLMGQDRTKAPSLVDALVQAGLHRGQRVGVVGWKYFSQIEGGGGEDPPMAVPQYVIQAATRILEGGGFLHDVTHLLMDPFIGLRACVSPAQVAEFEYGAALASEHVRRVLEGFKPGMTELEAARLMELNGYPQSCHPMVFSGGKEFIPLRSPTSREIEYGDSLIVAVGLWGGLTARGGIVADEAGAVPIDQFAGRYFCAIKRWYETVCVGISGSAVHKAVMEEVKEAPFRLLLNPGHLTSYEEWTHSPITADARDSLLSGMMLQCDLIPVSDHPGLTSNVEDTVCLGDEVFREELYGSYPRLADRVTRRRQFLAEDLGIRPSPDLIPLSNMPCYFSPLLLKQHAALSFA